MAVPDYQTLMLPLLRVASDKGEHTLREAVEDLAKEFRLSDQDRREQLPNSTQSKFDNRVDGRGPILRRLACYNIREGESFALHPEDSTFLGADQPI
jgi:restriction system protein